MPLPSTATLDQVVTRLEEMTGINEVTELAAVLNSKGIPASDTESMNQLITKVDEIEIGVNSNLFALANAYSATIRGNVVYMVNEDKAGKWVSNVAGTYTSYSPNGTKVEQYTNNPPTHAIAKTFKGSYYTDGITWCGWKNGGSSDIINFDGYKDLYIFEALPSGEVLSEKVINLYDMVNRNIMMKAIYRWQNGGYIIAVSPTGNGTFSANYIFIDAQGTKVAELIDVAYESVVFTNKHNYPLLVSNSSNSGNIFFDYGTFTTAMEYKSKRITTETTSALSDQIKWMAFGRFLNYEGGTE